MSRTFDARRLDVAAFAQAGARLAGSELLQKHERLAQEAQGTIDDLTLEWQVQGGRRKAVDGSWQPSIHLRAQARLPPDSTTHRKFRKAAAIARHRGAD